MSPPGSRSRPTSSTAYPFASESTSGEKSTSASARASAASSGSIGLGPSPGSGSCSQAVRPSQARMPVCPWTVNSVRIRPGRFSSSTKGAETPESSIVPVSRRPSTERSLTTPPRASR